MAWPGLAYLGLAWPGLRPEAGPCTALVRERFERLKAYCLLLAFVLRLILNAQRAQKIEGSFIGPLPRLLTADPLAGLPSGKWGPTGFARRSL